MITKGYLDKDTHIQSYIHTYVGLSSAKNWSFAWHLRIGMVALAWFSHILTVSHYQRGADLTKHPWLFEAGYSALLCADPNGLQEPWLVRYWPGGGLLELWQGKYWQILIDIDSVGCRNLHAGIWRLKIFDLTQPGKLLLCYMVSGVFIMIIEPWA